MTLLPLWWLGCVPKASQELVEVQLDATRTALSARTAACYEQSSAQEVELARLRTELQEAERGASETGQALAQAMQELEQERARLATLLTTPPPPVRGQPPAAAPITQTAAEVLEALRQRSVLAQSVEQRVGRLSEWSARFDALAAEGRVERVFVQDHLTVRFEADLVFNEGRTTISPRGELLLDGLAQALTDTTDVALRVDGHTDDTPFHSAEYASNWELGFGRAMIVVRALQDRGVTATMVVGSFAGTRPLVSNDTPEGRERNARIELSFDEDLSAWPGLQDVQGRVLPPVTPPPPEAPVPPPAN